MKNTLARQDAHEAFLPLCAQEAALRLLLDEARLVALNAAIESAAAARKAGVPGEDTAEAEQVAAAVGLLLQQIESASFFTAATK